MAIEAAEASLVPDAVFAQHLFGLVHGVAAPGASLAILRLRSVRGLRVGAAKGRGRTQNSTLMDGGTRGTVSRGTYCTGAAWASVETSVGVWPKPKPFGPNSLP